MVRLYRYPHPVIPDKWLYVGQTKNPTLRDKRHRKADRGFGLRFRKQFGDIPIPAPVIFGEPLLNKSDADCAEVVAMFQYHTWYGYPGGMNLILPSSQDYTDVAHLGGRRAVELGVGVHSLKWRGVGGRKTVELGVGVHSPEARARALMAARITGNINREKKLGIYGLTSEQRVQAGHKGGTISGNNNKEKSVGYCGLTFEQRSEAGHKGGAISGPIVGKRNVKSGLLTRIQSIGGKIGGRISGPANGRKQAPITNCLRWNIRRGKPCICGRHLVPESGIIPCAYPVSARNHGQ